MRKPGHCTCGLKLIERADMLVCPVSPAWPKATRTTHCTFATLPRTSNSPWGRIEHVDTLAEGVDMVHTASHGGVRLSEEVQDRLPSDVLSSFLRGPGWAEEDCEAPIVLALLDLTDERVKLMALSIGMKIERYRCAVPHLEDMAGVEAIGLLHRRQDSRQSDMARSRRGRPAVLHQFQPDQG